MFSTEFASSVDFSGPVLGLSWVLQYWWRPPLHQCPHILLHLLHLLIPPSCPLQFFHTTKDLKTYAESTLWLLPDYPIVLIWFSQFVKYCRNIFSLFKWKMEISAIKRGGIQRLIENALFFSIRFHPSTYWRNVHGELRVSWTTEISSPGLNRRYSRLSSGLGTLSGIKDWQRWMPLTLFSWITNNWEIFQATSFQSKITTFQSSWLVICHNCYI